MHRGTMAYGQPRKSKAYDTIGLIARGCQSLAHRFVRVSGSCLGKAAELRRAWPRTSDRQPSSSSTCAAPTVIKFMVPGESQSDFLDHELLISVERQAGGCRNSVAVQECMKVYTAASERRGTTMQVVE